MSSPDAFVVTLVLLSALLHASWHAVAKTGRDRLLTLWAVIMVGSLTGAALLCVAPAPDRAAWPFLIASFAVHAAYHLALFRMYQIGDLSQAYPIARGSAPLLVGLFAAGAAGEPLGPAQIGGLALSWLAISALAIVGGASAGTARRAVPAALLTGVLIGVYTVIDGMGVRRAGGELGFIGWTFLLDGIPMSLAVLALRRGRVRAFLRDEGARALAGGVVSTLSYSIMLWALAHGAMAQVSALRETSVVFAAMIGTLVLGEPFGRTRVVGACAVASGVLLLRCG